MDLNLNFFQSLHLPNVPVLTHQTSNEPKQSLVTQFKDRSLQEEQDSLIRLQYDFEFVQHLLSSEYIKFLSKRGYFKDPKFIGYLGYLQYFKQPQYLKLLIRPQCLDVLDMLLNEEVRREIEMNEDFANFLNY